MSFGLVRTLNALGLLGLTGILLVAFGYQFILGELPCPLCLLQRAGFAAAGVGLALNVSVGSRPSHYAMVIVSAVAGALISTRQILLHIVPGTGSFGSPLLGLHFYTWALIAFVLTVLAAAFLLMFERQFAADAAGAKAPPATATGIVVLFLITVLANAVFTFAECGFGLCPDDPTGYPFFGFR